MQTSSYCSSHLKLMRSAIIIALQEQIIVVHAVVHELNQCSARLRVVVRKIEDLRLVPRPNAPACCCKEIGLRGRDALVYV